MIAGHWLDMGKPHNAVSALTEQSSCVHCLCMQLARQCICMLAIQSLIFGAENRTLPHRVQLLTRAASMIIDTPAGPQGVSER